VLATTRIADVLADLDRALSTLQEAVRTIFPTSVSGDEARALVVRFSEAERAASSGVALFSPVVVGTGSYAKEGHASAPDWLGSVAGTSSGVAKGRLAAAVRAAGDPALTEALHAGGLSADQLKVIAQSATEVPQSSAELLGLLDGGASHQELFDAASSLKAAARSRECDAARRAPVHAGRHLRAHQGEQGGIRGEFFCDEVAWAKVAPILEAETKSRWKASGSKSLETLAARRVDAFIDLMARAATSSGVKGASNAPKAVVIVDAAALRRGGTHYGELCEIEGIGPVSVQAARELIGQSALHFVIREGFDIKTVTKSTRDVAICLEVALLVRDRTCAVKGCAKRLGLETDHRVIDFGDDGPTQIDNLVRLCPEHHAMKTYGGWRLEGSPGDWKWIGPAHPKSARAIAKARKVAAAKAKANRANAGTTAEKGKAIQRT
jgi:hypothetical protein